MQVPSLESFVLYEKVGQPDEYGGAPVWTLMGVASVNDPNSLYLWRNYNTFDVEPTKVPDGFVRQPNGYVDCYECVKLRSCCPEHVEGRTQYLQDYRFGTKVFAEDYVPSVVECPVDAVVVYTHDNGGRPFKVIVDHANESLSIYSLNRNVIFENKHYRRNYEEHLNCTSDAVIRLVKPVNVMLNADHADHADNPLYPVNQFEESDDEDEDEGEQESYEDEVDEDEVDEDEVNEVNEVDEGSEVHNEWNVLNYYDQLVETFRFKQVWIPYWQTNSFYGNSVLARLSDVDYLWIGHSVVHFTVCKNETRPVYSFNRSHQVPAGDEILRYYSIVGNSDVPYPVAVGHNYMYFMLDMVAQPIEHYAKLSERELADAYTFFYKHRCVICLNGKCDCVPIEKISLDTKTIMKRDF